MSGERQKATLTQKRLFGCAWLIVVPLPQEWELRISHAAHVGAGVGAGAGAGGGGAGAEGGGPRQSSGVGGFIASIRRSLSSRSSSPSRPKHNSQHSNSAPAAHHGSGVDAPGAAAVHAGGGDGGARNSGGDAGPRSSSAAHSGAGQSVLRFGKVSIDHTARCVVVCASKCADWWW